MDVGSNPQYVTITADGAYAYVTNYGNNTVSVINTASDTISATINVGSYPNGVAVTPNGEYAYVANYGSGTVSVISTASNTVTVTVTVGSNPWDVAIASNGEYAYVANYGSGTVSVISTATTASPTPKVPEFSNVALVSVAIAIATLCTIALTARTRKRLQE
jgi:YVTN family beta-propeller protein